MRRAAVFAIRVVLVVSLLLVPSLLLLRNWPEAGDEARRFLAPIRNEARQIMEHAAYWLSEEGEEAPRIPYREDIDVKATAPVEPVPAQAVGNRVEVLSRSARTIDGDTLDINGVRVRFHGIDAPESGQTCIADGRRWRCGWQAASALAARISGQSVACRERDRDRYGRIVAVCRVGGTDLNAWLVSEGWALAYRRYSADYVEEEASARAAQRGIWRGRFVAPWDWRAGVRLDSARAPVQRNMGRIVRQGTSGCHIKGNISRKGARIYHVPGDQHYEGTRISPSQGERWFCTEAEARAAGWRRSRR